MTRVTVTDAAHPLYGQTLEVVHDSSPLGKTNLTLRLPNGQTRSVPRQATNFEATNAAGDQAHLLPRISVRTILPLTQFVKHRLLSTEKKNDDPTTSSARKDNPGGEQAPNPVAAARPANASPVGPAVGHAGSENAPDGTSESGNA